MNRLRRLLGVVVCCLLAGVAVTATTIAFWAGGGTGAALASVANLGTPGAPVVSVHNGTAMLTWSAATAPGAASVTYWVQRRLDVGSVWVDACGTTVPSGTTQLSCSEIPGAGTFDWHVTALVATWTAVSAQSAATVVGSVDSVAPTVSLVAPPDGAAVRETLAVTAAASDSESGVASVQMQYAPAVAGPWSNIGVVATVAPYTRSWETTAVVDGTYRLRAVATDAVGNQATSPTIAVLIDNLAPSVAVTVGITDGLLVSGGANTYYFGSASPGSLVLTAAVADNGSGPASSTFPAPATSGWSSAGAPVVTTPSGGRFMSGAYSWSSGAGSIPVLTVVGADRAGNETPVNISLIADSTGPIGTVISPVSAAYVRGTISLATSPTDAGSGVASARFQVAPTGSGAWTDAGTIQTSAPWTTSWATPNVNAGYDIRVILTDRVGNVTTSVPTIGVHVTNIAPTIAVSLGADSNGAILTGSTVLFRSSVAGNVRVIATASGSSAVSATFPAISIAGWSHSAETLTTPFGGPFASSPISWTAGASTPAPYTVIASDAAGNTTTSSLTFATDNVGPAVTMTAPIPSALLRSATTLAATSTDAGAGVGNIRFERAPAGGSTWTTLTTVTVEPFSVAYDTTTIPDGLYDLRAVATDLVGNLTNSTIVAGVRVDNTPPTGTLTAPLNASNLSGTIAVTSNSTDAGAGVASALFQQSPAGAGSWTNIAAAGTVSPYGVSWVTTGDPDGLYDVRVVTTDVAGGITTSPTVTVRVDNTAPTGAITSPTASAAETGNFTITSNSADAGSGVATAQFQVSANGENSWANIGAAIAAAPYQTVWATGTFTEGLYDLRVVTVDRAGNSTTSTVTAAVRIDRTAPTGSITGPNAGARVTGNSVTVSATAADTGSGVATVQFQYALTGTGVWANLNAAAATSPYLTLWSTTIDPDATYDLRAVITDKAGNQFNTPLVAGVLVDNTAPGLVVSMGDPSNAARVGNAIFVRSATGGSFTLSAAVTDAGSGPASTTYPAVATTGWIHSAQTVTTPADGPYTSTSFTLAPNGSVSPDAYTVTAADVVGNTGTAQLTFAVDGSAPTGAITSPAANANVGGAVAFSTNAADVGSGVANVQVQYDVLLGVIWNNVGIPATSAPFTANIPANALTDGTYNFRLIITDLVGNTFTSPAVSGVRIDNTAPVALLNTPSAGAVLSGPAAALAGTATDTGSGVANVQFQYSTHGGSTWNNIGAAVTGTPYGTSWNTTIVADGLYDLRMIATDQSGNPAFSPVIPIQVNNSAAPSRSATSMLVSVAIDAGQPDPAPQLPPATSITSALAASPTTSTSTTPTTNAASISTNPSTTPTSTTNPSTTSATNGPLTSAINPTSTTDPTSTSTTNPTSTLTRNPTSTLTTNPTSTSTTNPTSTSTSSAPTTSSTAPTTSSTAPTTSSPVSNGND